tara:strand:- start:1255 stop:1512 length:258 start_codon:yes stop_codon:yes gene_type:complete
MRYEIWDSVSYGEMEPLTPFTKIYESDELKNVVSYVENSDSKTTLFVTLENGTILFDTTMSIYESPDGKIIYKRGLLSNNKIKIN